MWPLHGYCVVSGDKITNTRDPESCSRRFTMNSPARGDRFGRPNARPTSTKGCPGLGVSGPELLPRQRAVSLKILVAGLPDDLVGKRRARGLFVKTDGLEVVAHELLVEGRRGDADPVLRARPVPRRVGRQDLVDQGDLAFHQAELELRVGQDQTSGLRVISPLLVGR